MSKRDIKYYSKLKQKKYRESEGLFLIEGSNLIEECLKSDVYRDLLSKIFILKEYSGKGIITEIKRDLPRIDIIDTDDRDFKTLSETVNPQGIIGVVKKPGEIRKLKNDADAGKLFVLLDSINDPGNLGTILRTCYWFGVDKVFLSKDSADVYNSKVIRSSQGALFHLNISCNADPIKLTGQLFMENFKIILTDLKAEDYVSDHIFSESDDYLVVFGNESGGISDPILNNQNYKRIKIKGFSECESLNIAVSAGILLDRIRNR